MKTGAVPVEVARVLQRSFDARQVVDYGDYVDPSPEEVSDLRNAVHEFVTFCTALVDGHPNA